MSKDADRIENMTRAELESLARLALQRERRLFGYLTRSLPEGWRGKSMAELLVMPQGPGRLQATLNEALGWCNGVADRIGADGAKMADLGPQDPGPPPSPRCMPGCDRAYCVPGGIIDACPRLMPEARPAQDDSAGDAEPVCDKRFDA